MHGGGPIVDVRDVATVHAAIMEPGRGPRCYMITGHYRLPFSHEGIWISSLQPHCDDSRTASELGITSRDLGVTLADTVQWLADQGHLPVARAAGGSSGDRPRSEPSADT